MELSRVEIIMSDLKLEPLTKALGKFGITGMTVTDVRGCGIQNGTQEYEAGDSRGRLRYSVNDAGARKVLP